jgi:light-independent protochlorophyllide reductase subunit B
MAIAKVCRDELGFKVVGLGTYSREFAREVRALAKEMGLEALISDDYLEVEEAISETAPELVLGTQMERHVAKRLGIGCAVISAPVHVQDFPARHSPVMGFEGANVLFDTLVHPLTMGLEEHLLAMFREDFEFSDEAGASHLAAHAPRSPTTAASSENPAPAEEAPAAAIEAMPAGDAPIVWEEAAMKELKKIPFFVRGRARNNTEKYAAEKGLAAITVETLYDAKAHFGR